jgi:hypothetical protein
MPVSLSPGMTPSIKSDSAPNLSMLCLEPKGNKKGQHSLAFEAPELLALNFSFHSPSEKRLMFLRLASHYREAYSMMGGGWLRCDRYHTRNVCQVRALSV